MSLWLRIHPVRLCLLLCFALVTAGVLHAAQPDSNLIQKKIADCGMNCHVSLKLADHSKVKGKVRELRADSVVIVPRGSSAAQTVQFRDVDSVRAQVPLGERFKAGPCIGPVSIAIAAPFLLIAALVGH
ncbi:MAG TPA: hypothetical protein VGN16_18995 [Acidobacteriaceae bacterium]|jgi:hypothetical protein